MIISVLIPEKLLKQLDEMVSSGEYISRQEIIRSALSQFLKKEEIEKSKEKNEESGEKSKH